MQIVPRILNFERCSIVFTVKGDMRRTVDPVSPRTLSKTSARRAKQIDLPCSPSVAKRKTPFPLTNEHALFFLQLRNADTSRSTLKFLLQLQTHSQPWFFLTRTCPFGPNCILTPFLTFQQGSVYPDPARACVYAGSRMR